jgi:hypothetical protein
MVLVLAVLGGCSDDGSGPECLTNADCEGAAICLDGKCQTLGCQGGCPDGTYCDEASDECVACDVDEHCGASCIDCTVLATDRACVDGECGCRSEFHCAAGQTCENGKCVGCLTDCANKCGGADDGCGGTCDDPCETGHWCNDQACEACDSDQHCGADCLDCTAATNDLCAGTCQNGACLYPEGACGFCLTCDGQGNCVDVPAGEDPFEDCAGEPPCGQVCGGDGGCVFPDSSVVCGLDCQRCDGDGNCIADCDQAECRQNVWDCQCHPMPTALTCGSTAGGDLNNLDDTTDLFASYPAACNWAGNPLDGRETTYSFSFSGTPSPRQVAVSVYSVCGVSEIIALVMAGDQPCDPEQCVANQYWSGFA